MKTLPETPQRKVSRAYLIQTITFPSISLGNYIAVYIVSLLPALLLFFAVTMTGESVWHHSHCHTIFTATSKHRNIPTFLFSDISSTREAKNHRRAPKQFSQWMWLLSVSALEMFWKVSWPVYRCMSLFLQGCLQEQNTSKSCVSLWSWLH